MVKSSKMCRSPQPFTLRDLSSFPIRMTTFNSWKGLKQTVFSCLWCHVLSNYLSNAIKFTPCGGKVSLGVVCNGIFKTDIPIEEGEVSKVSEGEELNHEDCGRISSWTLDTAGKAQRRHCSCKYNVFVEVIMHWFLMLLALVEVYFLESASPAQGTRSCWSARGNRS